MISSPADCSSIRELAKALQLNENIPQSIIDFEIADAQSENALCQLGLLNENDAVKRIRLVLKEGLQSKVKVLGEILELKIKDYNDKKREWNHRQRRKWLEDIIRLLNPIEKDADAKILTLLAKTYLCRGLLYRPKGRIIPARKTEAIRKAVLLAEKAVQKLPNSFSEKEAEEIYKATADTWKTLAYACMELERADSSFKVSPENLKEAVSCIKKDGITSLNDALVLLTYTDSLSDELLALYEKEDAEWYNADYFLLKARIAFREKDMFKVNKFLKKAINSAPTAFAAPFWDDLVDFLKKLREAECNLWKKKALLSHHQCQKREVRIQKNIYLRWYWSRQKDLYDLAFLASDSLEKKARIADSLKSRPVLRYQALNELRISDKSINALLEEEDEARDERYIKKERESKKVKIEKRKNIPFKALPCTWIAIHFYMNELETREGKKGGHALIFDSQKNKWHEHLFDYRPLHQKFLSWQEAYLLSDDTDKFMADSLTELCRSIGDTMPFLFDETVIAKNSRVLWIPHGFLHRLPLHAAICRNSNKVFLEDHISRYLPAWHMLEKEKTEKSSSNKYLLKDFSDSIFNFLEKTITWSNSDYKTEPATPELLIDCMQKNPFVLAILCHGEGNILNPFKSILKMGSGISIIDILKSDVVRISGTRVMLGACESDMGPPTEHTIDEHLSLSTVFLLHHAKEVIAGLWKIGVQDVDKCYRSILKEDEIDFLTALNGWQKEKISEWRGQEGNLEFYHLAPFRVMGFPEISEILNKDVPVSS